MKKTSLFVALITSSILSTEIWAVQENDNETDLKSGTSQPRRPQINDNILESKSYRFQMIKDVTQKEGKVPQALFHITSRNGEYIPDRQLDLIGYEHTGFKTLMDPDVETLDPMKKVVPQLSHYGWAERKVQFSVRYNEEETPPTEIILSHLYKLIPNKYWKYDHHIETTDATLDFYVQTDGHFLESGKEGNFYLATQKTVTIDHDPIPVSEEVPGRNYFNGDNKVYRAIIKIQKYFNHKTNETKEKRIESPDGDLQNHKGNKIIYVEPFSLNDTPTSRDKMDYKGEYKYIGDVSDNNKKLQEREYGRLIYSDDLGEIYLPHVTQEHWENLDGSDVGFFIASYKTNARLSFVPQIVNIDTGKLPEGLYQLSFIGKEGNIRREKWRKLGEDSEKYFEIIVNRDVPSIPGMGLSAPRRILECKK